MDEHLHEPDQERLQRFLAERHWRAHGMEGTSHVLLDALVEPVVVTPYYLSELDLVRPYNGQTARQIRSHTLEERRIHLRRYAEFNEISINNGDEINIDAMRLGLRTCMGFDRLNKIPIGRVNDATIFAVFRNHYLNAESL